jgi:hypothetical protein
MPGRAVMGAAGAARSRAGDNNTLMTPPRATPNETPREGESTTAVAWMGFEFEDVVEAVGRHAAVEVHIPWYVIDPQGHNIRNQRLRELAKRHLHEQTADSAQFQRSLKRANTNRNLQSARHLPAPPPPGQEAKGAKAEKVIHASDKMPFFARLTLFPTWDVIAAIALLFTVIVTPFEVGFLKAPETVADLDALFFINRVVDLVFIVDMGLQFFIMVPKKAEGDGGAWGQATEGTLVWETRLSEIARRYATGWFLIDILSVAPFIFDILPLLDPEGGSSARGAKALRTIRALRLIKLLRLLRGIELYACVVDGPLFFSSLSRSLTHPHAPSRLLSPSHPPTTQSRASRDTSRSTSRCRLRRSRW